MRNGLKWKISLQLLVAVPSVSQTKPEVITVRVLHYRTGRPLRGRRVWLTPEDAKGTMHDDARMQGDTRNDGTVDFRLNEPLPVKIDLVDPHSIPCSPEYVSVDSILRNGVVGDISESEFCNPRVASRPEPHPGEFVFYVRPLSFWQRLTNPP